MMFFTTLNIFVYVPSDLFLNSLGRVQASNSYKGAGTRVFLKLADFKFSIRLELPSYHI